MTLRQILAADPEEVFLIADDFAETVVYFGGGGRTDPATFLAMCDVEQGMPDEQRGITEHQVLRLTVKRSRIPDPQLNDRVKLTRDGVETEYSYAGEVTTDDEHMRTLIFASFEVQRMGGNHVR